MKSYILMIHPNRVRRNYLGGKILNTIEGHKPVDGDKPEDWIASTVEAKNPGLGYIDGEGLGYVSDSHGNSVKLKKLFEEYGEFYLGANHLEQIGADTGFLVKFLDSSMRLHIQAHPTAEFAQKHLGSRWGKLEAYIILSVRDDAPGELLLGFQNAPSESEWHRIVVDQDMEAMHKCFTPVKVNPGEVWVVPGGLPHAIGAGVMVIEVMEPSDLVVRCEFERNEIIVPPEARFMGHSPEFALKIFDLTSYSVDEIKAKCLLTPRVTVSNDNFKREHLVGTEHTDCFRINKITITGQTELKLPDNIQVVIVSKGKAEICSGEELLTVKKNDRFIVAAAANSLYIAPQINDFEIIICEPVINNY